MGVEVFGVSMRLIQPHIFKPVWAALSSFAHLQIKSSEKTKEFEGITAEYNDSRHLIGFHLLDKYSDGHCNLAARFSLCSYKTIDPIFIEIVDEVLSSFEAEVWLMTSALQQKAKYLPGDTKWLLAALPDEIEAMREYWQKRFGKKQGCVRPEDSFSFVGLLNS